jgi:hypothetical protein
MEMNLRVQKNIALSSVTIIAALIAGCGGGGGGTTVGNNPALSANQNEFEKAFSVQGGYVNPVVSLPLSGAALPTSYFLGSVPSTIPSPSAGPQTVTFKLVSFANTLNTSDANIASISSGFIPNRYLKAGKIVFTPVNDAKIIYKYVGTEVLLDYLASDNTTVAYSNKTTVTYVPLSGIIDDISAELENTRPGYELVRNPSLTKPGSETTKWLSGSAFSRVQFEAAGDYILAFDCTASQTTKDANIAPCGTSTTLETTFPQTSGTDARTYQFTDGVVSTIEGVRTWVAKDVRPPAGSQTPAFRVYFELGGKVYLGQLIKSGTKSQAYLPGTTTLYSDFVRPNQAMMETLKSVLTF